MLVCFHVAQSSALLTINAMSLSNGGKGLDWKMSQTLRKRLIDINTLDMSHY
jgi:hypothetical protein